MIMGHVDATAFLHGQNKPISPGHVCDTAFLLGQKNPHHHIRSNRRSSTFGSLGGLFGALGALAVH